MAPDERVKEDSDDGLTVHRAGKKETQGGVRGTSGSSENGQRHSQDVLEASQARVNSRGGTGICHLFSSEWPLWKDANEMVYFLNGVVNLSNRMVSNTNCFLDQN